MIPSITIATGNNLQPRFGAVPLKDIQEGETFKFYSGDESYIGTVSSPLKKQKAPKEYTNAFNDFLLEAFPYLGKEEKNNFNLNKKFDMYVIDFDTNRVKNSSFNFPVQNGKVMGVFEANG